MTRFFYKHLLNTRILICAFLVTCTLPLLGLNTEASASTDETITGIVAETMSAAGYTYVQINTENKQVWVAIPETEIQKGDNISCAPGMEMKDFYSKTLDRTFESVIFSAGIIGAAAASPHASAQAATAEASNSFDAAVLAEQQAAGSQIQPAQQSGGSMGAIAPFSEISVEKLEGENSYTVAELYDKAKELDGKTIRVRGKVVKFNANIMGRNWLHIQDGTGDPMNNTHDLVVTTTAKIGSPDIIVIEGTLAADKDFGAGYKYAVIVENAVIIQ